MNTNFPTLLSLSFEEACNPARFAQHLSRAAEQQCLSQVTAICSKSFPALTNAARTVMNGNRLEVIFPDGIPKGAKLLLDKAGNKLPILRDGKTGQILKQARIAKAGGRTARIAGNSALALVQVCHLVSGADQVKRLGNLQSAIDRIQHARTSAMEAKLEGIFRQIKEITGSSAAIMTQFDRSELSNMSRELTELRGQWISEIKFQLTSMKRIQPSLLSRITPARKRNSLRNCVAERSAEASPLFNLVQKAHFTLMLQLCLSEYTGRLDAFITLTLKDEIEAWKTLFQFAKHRTCEISGSRIILKEWEPLLESLQSVEDVWKGASQLVLTEAKNNLGELPDIA